MNKLNDQDMIQLTRKALNERNSHSDIRIGQSYMNALYVVNPRMYKEITGTIVDCFHNDDNVGAFLNYIIK